MGLIVDMANGTVLRQVSIGFCQGVRLRSVLALWLFLLRSRRFYAWQRYGDHNDVC